MSKPHATTSCRINGVDVDVDVLIAPLVVWLCEQPGVITLYSCEGDPGGARGFNALPVPYVLFRVRQQHQLKPILELVHVQHGEDIVHVAECSVDWFTGWPRYRLSWASQAELRLTLDRLAGRDIWPELARVLGVGCRTSMSSSSS